MCSEQKINGASVDDNQSHRSGGAKMVSAALQYATRGWAVFPVRTRAKDPLLSGGFKAATRDPNAIRAWWAKWPDANIGLWPGASGLVVLDIDGPPATTDALLMEELDVGTLTSRTGRPGGKHLYFTRPEFRVGNSASLGEHIDVRCDAGYVLLPPSLHPSGTSYRWLDQASPIKPLSRVLALFLELAQHPPCPHRLAPLPPKVGNNDARIDERVRAYIAQLPSGLSVGQGRNKVAYTLGCWLLHELRISVDEARSWVELWNRSNSEPLPFAEIDSVLANALRYGRER